MTNPTTLAVILAAGRGSRLEGLPEGVNKCAFPIRPATDNLSPVLHMAHAFLENGVTRFCVTVGYAADSVRDALSPLAGSADIRYVENPLYASTGCNYSLARAVEATLTDEVEQVVVVEGDSLFPMETIGQMVSPPCPAAVLIRPESYINTTRSYIAVGRDDMTLRFAYDPRHQDVLSAIRLTDNETVLGESMDIWTLGGDSLPLLKAEYLRYAADVTISIGPFFQDAFLSSLAAAGCPMRPVQAKRPDDWINMNTNRDVEKAAAVSWLS